MVYRIIEKVVPMIFFKKSGKNPSLQLFYHCSILFSVDLSLDTGKINPKVHNKGGFLMALSVSQLSVGVFMPRIADSAPRQSKGTHNKGGFLMAFSVSQLSVGVFRPRIADSAPLTRVIEYIFGNWK
jgi:hypothetical protein